MKLKKTCIVSWATVRFKYDYTQLINIYKTQLYTINQHLQDIDDNHCN